MQETWLFIERGGIIMIPLLLSSIIVLAIVIERSIVLRKKKILIPEIIRVIEEIKKPDDIHHPLHPQLLHSNQPRYRQNRFDVLNK